MKKVKTKKGKKRLSQMKKKTKSFYCSIPTEQINPKTKNLDKISVSQIIKLINEEDKKVAFAVSAVFKDIEKAVKIVSRVYCNGNNMIFVGAGTSGRLGVLEAAECPPTFGISPDRVVAIMAGGKNSVFRAKEGAEDSKSDGARDVGKRISKGDVVIGIAASGVTPYVLGALSEAKKNKCKTVLITCNPKHEKCSVDVVIAPKTGPEVITGSTRMKAGTATKMILNMITSSSMILVGKTYRNYMVDLMPTNKKLIDRSKRLIQTIGRVSADMAESVFKKSNKKVKVAIIMARLKVTKDKAENMLKKSGGFLRKIIR
jgi:N-acetylmuramic acid 6-phosphate etherase